MNTEISKDRKLYKSIFSKFQNFEEYIKWAKEWEKTRKIVQKYCK